MKKRITIVLSTVLLISGLSLMAKSKTEEFKVYGNCGMCENRIEKAASGVDGVAKADWNKDTQMITVSFDESKTDIHAIHKAIADAGHDTKMHKAKDEVYNALPGCCKYERPASEGHSHKMKDDGCTRHKAKQTGSCCGTHKH